MTTTTTPTARSLTLAGAAADSAPPRRGLRARAARAAVHVALRGGLAVHARVMDLLKLVGRRRRPIAPEGADILLTGTFHSDNWIGAHLRPLARSARCKRIRVVTLTPLPPIDKVETISPPAWLVQLVGGVGARLLTFMHTGLRDAPDIVGGFHLLFNGLAAALLARMTGARALYFCVGGPAEVVDGGLQSENRLFARLERPDPVVERRLLRAVGACDLVVTMGTRAVQFFRQHGVRAACHVVAGGIDAQRFSAAAEPASIDLVLVGRLVAIKRIDLFLETVARVRQLRADVRAAVVGDGPGRRALEERARALGLEEHVIFAGQQAEVEAWLRRARVFVLTSDSEGLALSMMEAMLCGLPVVVSHVGDLADLVEDGVNGYLVAERTPEAFAAPILELLGDERRRRALGAAARLAAQRYELGATTLAWDAILGALPSSRGKGQQTCAA